MSFKTSLKNAAALSKLSGYASKKGRKRLLPEGEDYGKKTQKEPAMDRGTPSIGNGPDMEGRGTPSLDVDTSGESIEDLRKKIKKTRDSIK